MEEIVKVYIGKLIRDEIKAQKLTNGYVIKRLTDADIEMSETKFSNKLYGERDTFQDNEIEIINTTLGTSFS